MPDSPFKSTLRACLLLLPFTLPPSARSDVQTSMVSVVLNFPDSTAPDLWQVINNYDETFTLMIWRGNGYSHRRVVNETLEIDDLYNLDLPENGYSVELQRGINTVIESLF